MESTFLFWTPLQWYLEGNEVLRPQGLHTLMKTGGGDRSELLGLASLCPHPLTLVFFHICSAHHSPLPGPSAQASSAPRTEDEDSPPTLLLQLIDLSGLLHAPPTGFWAFLLGRVDIPHTLHIITLHHSELAQNQGSSPCGVSFSSLPSACM